MAFRSGSTSRRNASSNSLEGWKRMDVKAVDAVNALPDFTISRLVWIVRIELEPDLVQEHVHSKERRVEVLCAVFLPSIAALGVGLGERVLVHFVRVTCGDELSSFSTEILYPTHPIIRDHVRTQLRFRVP